MRKLWIATVVIVLFATASYAEKKDVTFNAADGFVLKGTFYSAGKAGPGILLLHQCNADRQIYDHLGTMLSTAGYNVLSFDFRGFGGSKAGEYTDLAKQRDRIMAAMPGDVDAAFRFLGTQGLVNPTATGIVAGSCGVNQGIHAAGRHPEVKALVLLSGGSDADGEAYIKRSTQVPILGAASEEDTDAAASIKRLVGLSTNRDSQLEMFKDAGHAASMFEKQPDLEADIVIFFRSNLSIGGYGFKPSIK